MSLRILIVDDSKMTRRIISGLVASRWTVCGEAKDGRSGKRVSKAQARYGPTGFGHARQ
jgi:CheY-like chemotaxis protein